MVIPVSWLLKAGLSEKLAALFSWVIPLVLVLCALWWLRADAYSDGERASDAKWELAAKKAEKAAVRAAADASEKTVVRQADFAAQVKTEKEKIDVAVAEGSSPFDVMFPAKALESYPVAP